MSTATSYPTKAHHLTLPYRAAIVIGASSGIGQEIARQLAAGGTKVAVVARRSERLMDLASEFPDLVLPFEHDVLATAEVPELFQRITGELGGLDLVVYASGAMPSVGELEFDYEKDEQMIRVNLLGAVAWLNQAAIRFQGTKSGTIVGIGSVAGDRGRRGQPVYNTTKAALATYLEALRNRLSRFGVKVVTIKPGPVATDMTAHLHASGLMPAKQAAQLILRKARRGGEHYLRFGHAVAFAIIRNIPSWIFRRLKI